MNARHIKPEGSRAKMLTCSLKIRVAFICFAALQMAACSSAEERAAGYYDRAMKLLADHDNARAALELRNAVRLKKDLIGAWRALAKIDEEDRSWGSLVADLQAIVDLDPNDLAARIELSKLRLGTGSPGDALSLVNAGLESHAQSADLHILKAVILYKLNEKVEAIREAQTALDLDPANTDALMILATDRLSRGDPQGALRLVNTSPAVEEGGSKGNLGAQLLKAKILEQSGNPKDAESTLRKLIELDPKEAGIRQMLIKFYMDQHDLDHAEKEIRALAETNPADATAALELVRFLYSTKKEPAAARQELVSRINNGGDVFPLQLALADMNFTEGKDTEARELLQQLINSEASPEHKLLAQAALGEMFLRRKDLDGADAVASEILRKDDRNVTGLRLRAAIRLDRGQPDAAIADLSKALDNQPRSIELMLLLARAYERNGSVELAEKQLADAVRASNFDVTVTLQYAAFLGRRETPAQAENALTDLNNRRPNNFQVLSALAEVKLAQKDWAGAREVAESIRRLGNNHGEADRILGVSLLGLNKYDEAIAAFRSAYEAAPDSNELLSGLVRALLDANKRDQAIAVLRSALAKDRNNANALALLGSVQDLNNAPSQALESFTAAVKAQPKNIVGYQALAKFYATHEKPDEAITFIRGAIKDQPELTGLHFLLAGLLERKNQYEAAISEYEYLLDRDPDNIVLVNNLASLLSDHRSDPASLEKAQSLSARLRKSPLPQFKDTLGWIRYRERDYKAAVPLLEEAVTGLPDQASARYHLAMAYISDGEQAKATEQLGKALALEPTGDLADQARAALKTLGPSAAR